MVSVGRRAFSGLVGTCVSAAAADCCWRGCGAVGAYFRGWTVHVVWSVHVLSAARCPCRWVVAHFWTGQRMVGGSAHVFRWLGTLFVWGAHFGRMVVWHIFAAAGARWVAAHFDCWSAHVRRIGARFAVGQCTILDGSMLGGLAHVFGGSARICGWMGAHFAWGRTFSGGGRRMYVGRHTRSQRTISNSTEPAQSFGVGAHCATVRAVRSRR